jgi:uncharacterized membrane protein
VLEALPPGGGTSSAHEFIHEYIRHHSSILLYTVHATDVAHQGTRYGHQHACMCMSHYFFNIVATHDMGGAKNATCT